MGDKRLTDGEISMNVENKSKQELIDHMLSLMVAPNVKTSEHTEEDEAMFEHFMSSIKSNRKVTAKLPLEFALRLELFNLIKQGKVFVDGSIKFTANFTNSRPDDNELNEFDARYIGNEFSYSFLDNHPGIINVDSIRDIPIDYEGFMAVPVTVLCYRNVSRFNIYRVIYTPKFRGKYIYPRVVISNKYAVTE